FQCRIPLTGDVYQATSIIRASIVPASPLKHTFGFTIRTLSLYHKLFCHCPRLSVQPFVKALCDLHGLHFKPYLMQQLSAAYDVYLEIKSHVRKLVFGALGRDTPNWRLMHSCPSCQHELKEDEDMEIRMMVSMDGNDSLKQFEHRTDPADESNAEADASGVCERSDPREGGGDYFLSRQEVDQWEEDKWEDIPRWVPENSYREWVWETGRCEDKWANMSNAHTACSLARFDENGIFLLTCRHGFSLSFCDMVKSGEACVSYFS
ncbi:hypothetical protein GYMLUDRAFT_160611, partial [Collybiopsis luxurians FD-317 M1]